MAAENAEHAANAGEHALTPASYISHHLTFLQKPIGEGGFWTLNVDTLVTSIVLGAGVLGFIMWVVRGATAGVPSGRQALVEFIVDEFINKQVKSIFDKSYSVVAPLAMTVFLWVFFMNAMDFLPVDIINEFVFKPLHIEEFRLVPTADVNTTFALALSVWFLMIGFAIKVKGLGGFAHELVCAPFGMVKPTLNPLTWLAALALAAANFLFQCIEYLSKPLSHSLRLFGNMYAGEIIFLLLWLLAASSFVGTFFSILFGAAWAVFHILIVLLQAYIFMMLTVVYISLAHEHH
ncbi:MAG: F0F1 ATP synthase subunit A [Nevskiaceae bacterium]